MEESLADSLTAEASDVLNSDSKSLDMNCMRATDMRNNREEIHESQKILTNTARALVNMFRTGLSQSHHNYIRCMDNASSEVEDPPTMKILPKVHKGPTAQGHPQFRPVVMTATGISSRAGDVLGDFLELIIQLTCLRMEECSTEEGISQLEEVEKAVRMAGGRNTMLGSLDVSALYPSLDQEQSAELVSRMVEVSPVKIKGVNYRCVQVYLVSNLTTQEVVKEGLQGLLPARMSRRGRKPGPSTRELGVKKQPPRPTGVDPPSPQQPPLSKWRLINPDVELTDAERRLILAKAVKVTVKTIFMKHIYQFGGMKYKHVAGGPIGLCLMSLMGIVVMDTWALAFLSKLDTASAMIWALMKYVDNVNVMIDMLDLGVEWVEEKLEKVEPSSL